MKFYTGRKECGCLVAACVDRPEWKKDTAKSVAEFISNGYTVEHIEQDNGPQLQTCKCGQTEDLPGVQGK